MSGKIKWSFFISCAILAMFVEYLVLRAPAAKPPSVGQQISSAAPVQAVEYTCSMHPQIRQPKAGKCPLCGMDLITVSAMGSDSACGARELKLSESAEKLAAIETVPVERKFVPSEIRMLGKIAYDADALTYVNARFSGRIDRLFVKSIGIPMKKGDRLAVVYSQELRVLLLELIQALGVKDSKPDDPAAAAFLNSVKDKYRFSGFTDDQLDEIVEKLKGAERVSFVNSQVSGMLLSITSPINGVLVDKVPVVGKYFEKGEVLFTVADLSRVWINAEAYETDLPWLKYGQDVEFTAEACPGRKFKGRLAVILPTIDEATRTVKIRINAENKDGVLKPGMFVNSVIYSKIAEGGKVVDSSLAGKWLCPFQPEVVMESQGKCEICDTALVSSEAMGFVDGKDKSLPPPLVIPASAPLITGKRAVVYVAVPGKNAVYGCREVLLGPRSGDYFIVVSGLNEGENVVTNGNFKIDSSFQILAKSSMMAQPCENVSAPADDSAAQTAKNGIPPPDKVLDAYFAVQRALFTESLDTAKRNAPELDRRYGCGLEAAKDLDAARRLFEDMSKKLYREVSASALNIMNPVYKFYCPMAFNNRGAFWLQEDTDIRNPYFGPAMPTCGELKETISGTDAKAPKSQFANSANN